MKKDTALSSLMADIKLYYGKQLLSVDEFISLFSNAATELHVIDKINIDALKENLTTYLDLADCFRRVSNILQDIIAKDSLSITQAATEAAAIQYFPISQKYTNGAIEKYFKDRCEHYHASSKITSSLYNGSNFKMPNFNNEAWHVAEQENGLNIVIEIIAANLIESFHTYSKQLIEEEKILSPHDISSNFCNLPLIEHHEVTAIQALTEITSLYIQQYILSSILHPLCNFDETIKNNIDDLFENYTKDKVSRVDRLNTLIKLLGIDENNTTKVQLKPLENNKITEITREDTESTLIADKPMRVDIVDLKEETLQNASANDIFSRHANNKALEVFKQSSLIEQLNNDEEAPTDTQTQPLEDDKITEITENNDEINLFISNPIEISISDSEKDTQQGDTVETDGIEVFIENYCEEKISDDKYLVIDNFYLIKEKNRYLLKKYVKDKKIGSGDDVIFVPEYKTISKIPYFITEKTHHIEKDIEGIRLAAIKDGKFDSHIQLTMSEVSSGKLKNVLRNRGILIDTPKDNVNHIDALSVETKQQIFLSDNVGWKEFSSQFGFVLPNAKGVGITGLEYSGHNPLLTRAISQGGSLQKWLSMFNTFKLEEAHPRLQFLLFSSLMPLFAEYYPLFSGITINIGPDETEEKNSSNGKSVMLRLLLSTQGDSSESSSSWFGNWKVTLEGLEKSLYTNIGSYHDDTSIKHQSITDKVIEDIIYSVSTGKGAETATKSSRERRTVLFSSGESDILGSKSKDGAYVRFINVGIKRSDYGKGDTKIIVDEIEKTTKSNYGFIYPVAIRIMLENRDKILSDIDKFKKDLEDIAQHNLSPRLAKQYATIAVCGVIYINAMKIITKDKNMWNDINPFEVSKEMFIVHDKKLLKMDADETEQHEGVLKSLLNNLTFDTAKKRIYDSEGNTVGSIKKNEYRIIGNMVEDYLPKDSSKFALMQALEKENLLIEKNKNYTIDGNSERCIAFRLPEK